MAAILTNKVLWLQRGTGEVDSKEGRNNSPLDGTVPVVTVAARLTTAGRAEGVDPVALVRVLFVEDHEIFRELFASAFEREPGFEVVAQAGTVAGAREALEDLGEGGVDVVVLDLRLPDVDGTDLIGDLRVGNPHGVALVLTASLELAVYARAVRAGAAGVVHKLARLTFRPYCSKS
jgi:CheY-like chemotaxis protein